MENVILLLYLKDAEYGKRFLRFLVGKKNPHLHPELVTAADKIKMRVGMESEELVVLTDDMGVKEDEKRKVIYLSNKQDVGNKTIFQYQKAEGIYRELLMLLQLKEEPERLSESVTGQDVRGLYCVFSPDGTESTLLSVTLAQYLGSCGKCLYLSLSGFPVFYSQEISMEPEFDKKGLGELLFLMNQEEFSQRQEQLCMPFGNACMLAPISHYKDLLDCSLEEWKTLFHRIFTECEYDSVVVEMGQLFEYTLDLMEMGDRVFVVKEKGLCGRVRNAVFRKYCHMEKKEALERKAQFIELPFDKREWEQALSGQPLSQLSEDRQRMAYVRELVEVHVGGEEDVCIIEEDVR